MIISGKEYTVASGNADTLTLLDPNSTLVNGTYTWELWGHEKGQRAHLMNFTILYEMMNEAGTFWRSNEDS